jgi:hypothetical protein
LSIEATCRLVTAAHALVATKAAPAEAQACKSMLVSVAEQAARLPGAQLRRLASRLEVGLKVDVEVR